MTKIQKFISGVFFIFALSSMFSCNLEDFNMDKLTKPDNIIPDIYAPLVYGTFKVPDLVTVPIPDAFLIPDTGILLDSIMISKSGTSFRSSAIDSVYLITNFNNDTPCNLEFSLSFIDNATGTVNGQIFQSGTIPANTIDNRIQFNMGPADQDNLMNSTGIKLNFKLFSPPGSPVIYKAVKKTSFTIKVAFHAPVKTWKL